MHFFSNDAIDTILHLDVKLCYLLLMALKSVTFMLTSADSNKPEKFCYLLATNLQNLVITAGSNKSIFVLSAVDKE